ncbi:FecR domain-containing protein [Geminicoccaceae bacterium 1502E]|nr:FecR domain-containing protein [Geminicoccaceae bacterium 1502E]
MRWGKNGKHGAARRRPTLALALLAALATVPSAAAEAVRVRVQDGQSLRAIAAEHLGDPDLWTEILRANGLASVADLVPGMELSIPAAEVLAAGRALGRALAALQLATEQGARLFAAPQIEKGLALYEEAVLARKAGAWEEAVRLAGEATLAAAEAGRLAGAGRDAAAEARLSDRQGFVEGRQAQELVWTDRPLDAVLVEEERVRTLSRSTAQITFRDDSRLRLSANSQAVIERMRVDRLSRREEAKVSLVEGDFYALLSGQSERRAFALDVPEVETEVESRDFWVRRDDTGARFTNYDERPLNVAARGSEVELGRNQGTLVRSGSAPTEAMAVLPAVALAGPADDAQAFEAEVTLRWQGVAEAVGYWLELARDPLFKEMTASQWGLRAERHATAPLEPGTYYWRVAALDRFGLPGERSEAWRFHVRVDRTPPFLSIREPAEGAILRTSPIEIRGEAEPGAALELGGRAVTLSPDGLFAVPLEAVSGRNEIVLEAQDEAGNRSRQTRSFVWLPDEAALLRFDETIPRQGVRHFLTDRAEISLAGLTEPAARLVVRGADGTERATAFAAGDGRFALNLPLVTGSEELVVAVVRSSGFASEERITVTQDREAPAIELEPPPPLTSVDWLALRGRAPGASSLALNGREVRLEGEAFEERLTLRQGANRVELVASDAVGNLKVESFEIVLDQEPPELIAASVTPRRLAAGGAVRIEVEARDASGLKKVAPFRLVVGQQEVADFLELGGGSFRKTLHLPRGLVGPVRLREVELEDYAGNKARFAPEG